MTGLQDLLALARQAADNAYAPYSRFRVGAAVLAGGRSYVGCNVENASFSLTICAERSAVVQAVAGGHRRIEAVAVACIDASADSPVGLFMPCGACRQVIGEFAADPEIPIEILGAGRFPLSRLLPFPFTLQRAGMGSPVAEGGKA